MKTLPFIVTLLMEVKKNSACYIWFWICSSLSSVHTYGSFWWISSEFESESWKIQPRETEWEIRIRYL